MYNTYNIISTELLMLFHPENVEARCKFYAMWNRTIRIHCIYFNNFRMNIYRIWFFSTKNFRNTYFFKFIHEKFHSPSCYYPYCCVLDQSITTSSFWYSVLWYSSAIGTLYASNLPSCKLLLCPIDLFWQHTIDR